MKKVVWTFIEDLPKIERRLIEWNIPHFNQTSETPLAQPHWEHKLDLNTKSDDELDHLLRVTLCDDDTLNEETKCFLRQIQTNIQQPMPKTRTLLTEEKCKAFYRKNT